MACASFDGQVVRRDDEIGEIAKQFVCVRMQSMNGVDINLFQFERDLTWMSFFMNASNQIYARYGGRDDSAAESHLTQKSLVRTMQQVLDLHRTNQPFARWGERTREPARIPEDIPTMSAMLAKRKDSKCIHCHDVKVAELKHAQQLGRFTRDMVFTYPAPSAIGIQLDPDVQNQVSAVTPDSPAHRANVRPGDTVLTVGKERVLTFADFTRVLEVTSAESTLSLQIERGAETIDATLKLSGNWRRTEDPSWRESLHVAGPNGGFWGHKLADNERAKHNAPTNKMAVLITFIWGDHTRRAGIKVNDIVVKFDGMTNDMTLPQLHAHLNLDRNYGDTIPITIRRNGKDHELVMTLPKARSADE